MEKIPCPFVYKNGRACTGHIERIEAYHAEMAWELGKDDKWEFAFSPRTHYHLFCSEKGNHAGPLHPDDGRMKFWWDDLPEAVRALLDKTGILDR